MSGSMEESKMQKPNDGINFVDELIPAEVELGAPEILNQIHQQYNGYREAQHQFVKDGILLQPGFPPPLAASLFKNILGGVNDVKDEHFPQMGLVAASFLRLVALSTEDLSGQSVIKIDLYFRFTVDNCPAGERLFEKVKDALGTRIVDNLKLEPESFVINVRHGGSPHSIEDINDNMFREYFRAVMSGCDPTCADWRAELIKKIRENRRTE